MSSSTLGRLSAPAKGGLFVAAAGLGPAPGLLHGSAAGSNVWASAR